LVHEPAPGAVRLHAGDALFEDRRHKLIEHEFGCGLAQARVSPGDLRKLRLRGEIEDGVGMRTPKKRRNAVQHPGRPWPPRARENFVAVFVPRNQAQRDRRVPLRRSTAPPERAVGIEVIGRVTTAAAELAKRPAQIDPSVRVPRPRLRGAPAQV
jgi:hypothetical protein